MTTVEHAPPDFLTWVASLVHRHRDRLLRYARRHGLHAEDALDAVQDAFVTFLGLPGARDLARSGSDAIRMLTTLLKNHAANRRRKLERQQRGLDTLRRERPGQAQRTSAELIAEAEQVARVRGCILQMAKLQRAVIELSLIDGESHDTIAGQLGITAGHARVLLHRARAHLRSCSEPDEAAARAVLTVGEESP